MQPVLNSVINDVNNELFKLLREAKTHPKKTRPLREVFAVPYKLEKIAACRSAQINGFLSSKLGITKKYAHTFKKKDYPSTGEGPKEKIDPIQALNLSEEHKVTIL